VKAFVRMDDIDFDFAKTFIFGTKEKILSVRIRLSISTTEEKAHHSQQIILKLMKS
jgi:hypothetical protein